MTRNRPVVLQDDRAEADRLEEIGAKAWNSLEVRLTVVWCAATFAVLAVLVLVAAQAGFPNEMTLVIAVAAGVCFVFYVGIAVFGTFRRRRARRNLLALRLRATDHYAQQDEADAEVRRHELMQGDDRVPWYPPRRRTEYQPSRRSGFGSPGRRRG